MNITRERVSRRQGFVRPWMVTMADNSVAWSRKRTVRGTPMRTGLMWTEAGWAAFIVARGQVREVESSVVQVMPHCSTVTEARKIGDTILRSYANIGRV